MNRNEIDEFIEDNFGPHDKLTILELVDELRKMQYMHSQYHAAL